MTTEQKIEAIVDLLDDMLTCDIIWIYNEYCESIGYYEDRIHTYEELDDLCCGMEPTEIIEKFGDLTYCDFWKDGVYGAESADCSDIDIEEIASYCVDNDDSLYNSDIRDILDEEDDDEEE